MPDGRRRGRTSGDEAIGAGLARGLSEFARSLQSGRGPEAVLQLIVDAAAVEIDNANHAAVSLARKQEVTTPASTR